MSQVPGSIPAIEFEDQEWDWRGVRASSRHDRTFRHYQSAIPVDIADIDLRIGRTAAINLNEAAVAVAALESDPNIRFMDTAGALLRSESVGSSRIERLDADARTLGLAAIGEAGRRSVATQVWANVRAMQAAIAIAGPEPMSASTFSHVHSVLMIDDPYESKWAGKVRDMQNWIGGSNECPREALHVPPAPARLPALMADLAEWCNRRDVIPLAHAAIAHAQFETIHPYTDGNGRTGRAIIHTILRRDQITTTAIVPISAALLADVDGYFGALGEYRAGRVDDYLSHFAHATSRAAREAQVLGDDLRRVAAEWTDRVQPRPGSVAEVIMSGLIQQPVISASHNSAVGQVDTVSVYRAIDRLENAGVLTEITAGRRNRIWVAVAVTAALDDFADRIGRRRQI